jgi:rare lipoprotein A (peptidoglycan hydrolase)
MVRWLIMASTGLALAGAARAEQRNAPPTGANPLQALFKDLNAAHAAASAKIASAPPAVAPTAQPSVRAAPPRRVVRPSAAVRKIDFAPRRIARAAAAKIVATPPRPDPDAAAEGYSTIARTDWAPAAAAQVIRASWYGGGERLSLHTSNGEMFRPMELTAAHRTLPFGTMLRVSSLATGLSTVVRINDRGPAPSSGCALDLSRGAAMALGIAGMGASKVSIEVMR